MAKKVTENFNTMIIALIGAKPIAFNPLLAKIAGSATAGLFMSQMLYWWDKGSKPDWIYKTIGECKDETCLTRSEQDRSIKKWVALEVLKIKKAGIPARRHFNIDVEKLIQLLKQFSASSLQETANQSAKIGSPACNSLHSNTESTSENSKKIQQEILINDQRVLKKQSSLNQYPEGEGYKKFAKAKKQLSERLSAK